jgi:hypothetical protein
VAHAADDQTLPPPGRESPPPREHHHRAHRGTHEHRLPCPQPVEGRYRASNVLDVGLASLIWTLGVAEAAKVEEKRANPVAGKVDGEGPEAAVGAVRRPGVLVHEDDADLPVADGGSLEPRSVGGAEPERGRAGALGAPQRSAGGSSVCAAGSGDDPAVVGAASDIAVRMEPGALPPPSPAPVQATNASGIPTASPTTGPTRSGNRTRQDPSRVERSRLE